KKGSYAKRADATRLLLSYTRERFARATSITSSQPGAFDELGVTFDIEIPPHGTWSTELDVAMTVPDDEESEQQTIAWVTRRPHGNMAQDPQRWPDRAPRLECDWEPLQQTYRRSLVDLAALRFSPLTAGKHALPAAGLPWFMTMFGRDSILTSLQALPFAP